MEYTLESCSARAVISTMGAEIHSFRLKDRDFEYMWNGDPRYWAGRNPILFPQVNCVDDKINIYRGKEHVMGNHGFARSSEFEHVSSTENSLILALRQSEKTLEMFPYRFELKVTYRLEGARMNILYEITNDDEDVMPFGFGLHPAFSCPIDPDKKMEDYRLVFSAREDADFLNGRREITVTHSFLDPDDKLIRNHRSSTVTMTDGSCGVKVGTEGFRMLMFWSKPNAPYVCIEPWMFTQDKKALGIPFAEKEGAILLNPAETFTIGTYYEIF